MIAPRLSPILSVLQSEFRFWRKFTSPGKQNKLRKDENVEIHYEKQYDDRAQPTLALSQIPSAKSRNNTREMVTAKVGLMNCPACRDARLQQRTLKSGIEVDVCKKCFGVWLDQGELNDISKSDVASRELTDQLKCNSLLCDRNCPRCKRRLNRGTDYSGEIEVEFCTNCQGIWCDEGELPSLIRLLKQLESCDPDSAPRNTGGLGIVTTGSENFTKLLDPVLRLFSSRFSKFADAFNVRSNGTRETSVRLGMVNLSTDSVSGPISGKRFGSYVIVTTQKYTEWAYRGSDHDSGDPKYIEVAKSRSLGSAWNHSSFELTTGEQAYHIDLTEIPFEISPHHAETCRISSDEGTSAIIEHEYGYAADGERLFIVVASHSPNKITKQSVRLVSDKNPKEVLRRYRQFSLLAVAILLFAFLIIGALCIFCR